MKPEQIEEKTKQTVTPVTDVFETLAEALTNSDPAVRQGAVKELGKRKEKRALNALVELLTDDETKVRMEAASALNELGWRPANESDQARQAVASQRFQLAATLGQAAIDPLLLLLKDQTASFRMAALETLAKIGGAKIFKPVIEVLKDENPHVRAVAVQALCKVGNLEAVEPLAKLVRDNSWEVRSVVLDALTSLQTPSSVDIVIKFIKDESPDLRQRACEILADMADHRAIGALAMALVDHEINVRTSALLALQQIDSNWENSEFTRTAAQELLPSLKDNESSIRQAAADALRRIGQTRAMNAYLTSDLTSVPQPAIKTLLASLQSCNRDVRQAAVEALGRIGDVSMIPHLVEALRDQDEWVREAALYALNTLSWQPANDSELVLKAVILQRWETAILFDTVALYPLVMMLSSQSPEICTGAVDALGKIGNTNAIEPLTVLLQHPDKSVRNAAVAALRTLGWQTEDPTQCVSQAIELRDWQAVAQYGAVAVQPLISTIKGNQKDRELCDGAAATLATISDPAALKLLLPFVRDGQIAASVVQSIQLILESGPANVDEADLKAVGNFTNVVQFQYSFDARYNSYVRSGMQSVDTSRLKKLAMQQLVRRGLAE
ncbi:MAG: lyase domain protein repeat-containing protein [Verrucomicrobiales bacterium]|nr:lyase domain protein repeat-containing protein [Verrucomicrobiales bacterium]